MQNYQDAGAYLKSNGIQYKLNSDNSEVAIQCLFCDDKKKHLYIKNQDGCWTCHRCGAKGSWRDLLKKLGETTKILLDAHTTNQPVTKVISHSPKLHRIIDDVEKYHVNLPDRIYEYLKGDERGLNVDTIGDFRIGWDGNSITIPVFDKRGKPINIRHRRDPKKTYGNKMWNEKGGKAALFNISVLQEQQKFVILCEGEFDCMIEVQNGFPAVSGTAGANTFKPGWVDEFKNVQKVYICYDSDKPGEDGALNAARHIGDKAYIVKLPKGKDGQKIDITDYFCKLKKTPEDFQKLLESAEQYIPENTSSEDTSIQGFKVDFSDLSKIKITSDNFIYVVKPLKEKVDLSLYQDSDLLNRDTFRLNSVRSRNTFVKACNRLDVEKQQLLKNELMQLSNVIDEINRKILDDKKQLETIELTPDEVDEAKELLKSPELLHEVSKIIKKLGVAGEEKTALLHYLVLSSGKTDDPLSVVVKGESSVGKSYVIQQVLKLFPKESYLDITDATGQSFYYAPENHFAHKIIIVFEKHGGEKADYSIRTFQSEKKLKIQVTVKDPATGQFVTQEKEVNGPVGFITTTTDASIHQENETRNISVFPDETVNQTSKTFEMTDAKYRGLKSVDADFLSKWVNIQRVTEPLPVIIPFVEEIRSRFPTRPIRVRRDYGKLLSIISVIALIHQEQREKVENDGVTYIKATLADFYIAKVLLEETLRKTIYSLSPKSESLIAAAKDIPNSDSTGFSIRQLSDAIDWDYDTAHKWFKPAFKKGYFQKIQEHTGSKAALYTVVNKELPSRQILPSVNDLYDINSEWLSTAGLYDPITGKKIELKPSRERIANKEKKNDRTDVPMDTEQALLEVFGDEIEPIDEPDKYKTDTDNVGTSEQSDKSGDTP